MVGRFTVAAIALAALCIPLQAGYASDYADTAKKVLPGVVKVRAYRPDAGSEEFARIFEQDTPKSEGGEPGEKHEGGTGFVVDAAAGLIVTAAYIVGDATRIEVELAGGEVREAALAGADDTTGVAVVRVAPERLAALAWSDAAPETGERVLLFAAAFGKGPFVTEGIVSAYDVTRPEDEYKAMWLDLLVDEGAAGAPVVSADGRVVGMAFGRYGMPSRGARQNFGIAAPAADILPIVRELAANGKIARSAVGVSTNDSSFGGVAIAEVFDGSPAEKAGLKRGDEVVSVNGEMIRTQHELRRLVARAPVGSMLTFIIRRKGEQREIDVVTAAKTD